MRWDHLKFQDREKQGASLFPEGTVVRQWKTPEFRNLTCYEIQAKSIINHVPHDNFGFSRTINPYRGCSHACSYCFARPTHTYLEFNANKDFETQIVVKINAVEKLHVELRKPGWKGEMIAMGTNTDPYQTIEAHYKLMRGILRELNQVRNPYHILTKGSLIQRDIDLLKEGVDLMGIHVNLSIPTVDEKVWKTSEPGTPHPMKRMETVQKLNESGVPCGVFMGPIIPFLSDSPEQLEATVKAAAQARAIGIIPIVLHLRPGVREEYLPWLKTHHPDLVEKYQNLYQYSEAPKSVQNRIYGLVENFLRQHHPGKIHPFDDTNRRQLRSSKPAGHLTKSEQMSFDLK